MLTFHSRLTWPSPITPSGCGGKTLGPPTLFDSNPDAVKATSRTTSASSRKRFCRPSSLLYGSAASRSARATDDCRYVADVTISRCIALGLHGARASSPGLALESFEEGRPAEDGRAPKPDEDVGVPMNSV